MKTKPKKPTEAALVEAENAITDFEEKVSDVIDTLKGNYLGSENWDTLLPAIEKSCLPKAQKQAIRRLASNAEEALDTLKDYCEQARQWCEDYNP